ncbi:MAG: PilZ domain-containing protein [Myxococcota bacterium]
MRKRRALRRALEVPCQVVAENGFRLVGRGTRDLSPLGVRARCVESCSVGERVFVSVRMPSGMCWLDAEGEVIRLVFDPQSAEETAAYVAVLFRPLPAVDRAILDGALLGFPPPIPDRPLLRDYAKAIRDIAALSC